MIRAHSSLDAFASSASRTVCRIALFATALAAPLTAGSVQIVEATDGATLYLKISQREITRIALDHGRIAALRSREGELAVDPDEDAGQVFVSLPAGTAKPVNAFLTTANGHTFTLLLQPVDAPADSIIIRQPDDRPKHDHARKAENHVRAQRDLLLALATDAVPRGVEVREVAEPRLLWKEAAMTLQRQLSTHALVGERYLVVNQSAGPLTLEEREFYRPGVNAVGIDRLTIGPGDATGVYIVRERDGND